MTNLQIQVALKSLRFYTGLLDGDIGPKTNAAINKWKESQKLIPEDGKLYPAEKVLLSNQAKHILEYMDEVSIKRIQTAYPTLREELENIYLDACSQLTGSVKLRFTHVLRTFQEQNALYAQGRTKKGNIVTNAKGGQSFHNYGVACDFALMTKDGKSLIWDDKKDFDGDGISDWMEVVKVFKKYGWEWGGDWKFVDKPHFQKTMGYSTKQLLERWNRGLVFEKNGIKYVQLR